MNFNCTCFLNGRYYDAQHSTEIFEHGAELTFGVLLTLFTGGAAAAALGTRFAAASAKLEPLLEKLAKMLKDRQWFKKRQTVEANKNISHTNVRHSQKTVSYNKKDRKTGKPYTYDDIKDSMEKDGWQGEPIDVVEMPDGEITSIDNTRVRAAKETGTEIQANVRKHDELLPDEIIEEGRFGTPKVPNPKTWGEAASARIQKQGSTWEKENPFGSHDLPRITGKPNE